MAIDKLREINEEWGKVLLDYGYNNSFWNYEPFSNNYWLEKPKIVFCNLEPYGDVGKDNHLYSLTTFEEHLNKGIPTIKWTSLFVYCLYKRLHGEFFSIDDLERIYKKNDELLSVMKNITYMNLRKEESWTDTKNQQTEEIKRFLVPGFAAFKEEDQFDEIDREYPNKPNREYTLKFIKELEPDIFIVSGTVGCDILNKIYEGKINLAMNKTFKFNDILFVSVNHPSRSFSGGYQYIIERTAQIIDDYNKGVGK